MKKSIYRNSIIVIIASMLIFISSQFGWAAQIKLAWDANTASVLAGYKVYYGTASKSYIDSVDVGDVTTYTLTGLTAGQTYFIVVTDYDKLYYESGYSNEVSGVAIQVTSTTPSPPPTITPTPTPTPTPTSPPSNTTGNKKGWGKNKKSALQIFFGLAYVNVDGSPIGNLKSYEISAVDNGSNSTNPSNPTNPSNIVIIDATNTPALDSDNLIKETSKSYWSSEADGKKVDQGGVGEVLLKREKSRNIFTFLGDQELTAKSNSFETSNQKITPELLGLAPRDMKSREKLIQFIQGYDVYSNEKGTSALVKRAWILGAIVNSRPLVMPYGDSRSAIFVGANDGMLHAFDDATGEELWSFIPDDLLGKLMNLVKMNPMKRSVLKYYVDGSPKAYLGDSQKIIIFGLGRGGSHYYALDVTDPEKPKFLWKIGPETKDYSEIGQSWSTPQIGKIKYGKGEKVVCFIGGGYDENQDRNILMTPDRKGRAVFVADLFTGSQLWRWDHEKDPNMIHSIPSDIARVDTDGDGYIDRLYVGDTGGNLWRFDMNTPNPKSWSGKILFNSNTGATDNTRKIFYRPDVTLENGYEMVFFGTGDREHSNEIKTINKFFAIRDTGINSTFSEKDLAEVTKGTATVQDFDEKKGWFINLEAGKGEKVFAPPVVLFKVVYFPTFTPPSEKSDSNGIARIYALDYKNGGPILNLNPANDTEKVKIDLSDRSKIIGTGIPSGTVISVLNGKLFGFTGVNSGGIYNTPLRRDSALIPIWWREVSKK